MGQSLLGTDSPPALKPDHALEELPSHSPVHVQNLEAAFHFSIGPRLVVRPPQSQVVVTALQLPVESD